MGKYGAIGIVVVILVLGGGVIWWWQQQQNPELMEAPSAVAKGTAAESKGADLANSVDDREADEKAFEAGLRSRVDGVIEGKAQERTLPTAALPILQMRLAEGTLPAATTRSLGDALAADEVRLHNALAARKRQAWYRKNCLDIFERNAAGKIWAAPARATVEAAVRLWSGDYMCTEDERMIIYREAHKAVNLHCEEPLFVCAWAQNVMYYYQYAPNSQQFVERNTYAGAHWLDVDTTGYPAILKMEADLLAARGLQYNPPIPKGKKKFIQGLVDKAKSRFGEVLADPDISREDLMGLFDVLGETSVAVYGDRRELPNSLFNELKASSVDKSTVLTIQGRFNVDYAWDARGTGFANSVTESGARLMTERLARAATALENAWQLDSSNFHAAEAMLQVELGQGQGRDRMELWFNRAMKANPDDYEACMNKLAYLGPNWYGSKEDMLSFGRQCVAEGNWDAGIPYILVQVHLNLARYSDGSPQDVPLKDYYEENPGAWDEIRSVYAEDRKHSPRSVRKELEFARVAAWTNHWDEASQMFREANGALDLSVSNEEEMKLIEAEVEAHRPSTRPAMF